MNEASRVDMLVVSLGFPCAVRMFKYELDLGLRDPNTYRHTHDIPGFLGLHDQGQLSARQASV